MTRALIALVLLILVGYGVKEALPLALGPALSVASPAAYTTATSSIVTVSGNIQRVALLTLDGIPLLHDEHGNFSKTLTFPRGTSILSFIATDQFGRHTSVTRTISVSE